MTNPSIPAHRFVRPGQVGPDLPPPDQCVRCGFGLAAHAVEPEHDVRFYGRVRDYGPAGGEIVARCQPCEWSVALEGGHTVAELARLERMHAGTAVVTAVSKDGAAVLAPADLLTVLGALRDAADFCDRGDVAAYRMLARALGDDR